MDRIPLITGDGSLTLVDTRTQQTYHSVHGAIAESEHVFIGEGLHRLLPLHNELVILEAGWGTGLNTLLTVITAEQQCKHIHYTAVEPYPLTGSETEKLNYCAILQRNDLQPLFLLMHACKWETAIPVHRFLTLHKMKTTLQKLQYSRQCHLIYFDAFAPSAQPGLWTKDIFTKLCDMLLPGGMLVTYSSKGEVRRNMEAAGFTVIKKPGPAGKREMVTAYK
ncbi:MAG: tRNA (5-methylaminomethyl-2-thiouridine)(34)-methyltransferase MnmD [Chitinophagaceae bacterium]|nr:tRNA (5-methylaminomethyl-2-thiouridine)(34)-methyltransferase MnmD [Chitinophagaceae bacterium]